ncbi:MAG: T9SS type A sorting domain-containing protein [Bacteroidota bacterium]
MKRKFTKIVLSTAALCMFMAVKSYAATITATVSGNWSSASTWSGGAAGATVGGLDNIVIPAGINVNLDMDVQVTSLLSSISVSGTLTSTASHSLMINQGTLSGNGDMNLYYLELGTVGGMSFSGDLAVNHFITSNSSLNLGAQVTLMDTLCLKAGSLTLGSGSILTLNTNSNIKVDDGSIAIGGGLFAGTNSYNVMYVGSSKTSGIELGGTGFNDMHVKLSGSNQTLTLASNTTVNGILHHTMGSIALNGRSLTIKTNYMTSTAMFSGSATSTLVIQTSNTPASTFMFNTGAQTLNNLTVDVNNSGVATLGTNLAINGELMLNKGDLNISSSSTITMNAGSEVTVNDGSLMTASNNNFNGTASYDVNYIGYTKSGGVELTGSGLSDVTLDMNSLGEDVSISSNTTIDGTLTLNKGTIDLFGNTLQINGDLSSTQSGRFKGNATSDLMINTNAGLNDTIFFIGGGNTLQNLSINTGNGSNVMMGSNLMVENLTFVDGGITIYNNDITVISTGMITGAGMNEFIMMKGTGKLMMNVNTSSPYVLFPVGTTSGYAPVHVQRTAGTSAELGVNTWDGVYAMGSLGSGANMASSLSVVDRTWDISSASTSSVNMNVKFEWPAALEMNAFDRTMAYVSQYGSNWDAVTPTTSTVSGTMYQLARNGVTSPGMFAVVDNLSALSVKEQEEITFSLFPNPTQNNLTVVTKDNDGFTVEVFDALGNKAVSEKAIKGSSTNVDFSSLATGVYFVKISNDKTQSIRRVVKQ